jgi:hypothetical protein
MHRALGRGDVSEESSLTFVTLDDLQAELAGIDENLMRHQLSPAQEAAAVARRKVIYLKLHPETGQGACSGSSRPK